MDRLQTNWLGGPLSIHFVFCKYRISSIYFLFNLMCICPVLFLYLLHLKLL